MSNTKLITTTKELLERFDRGKYGDRESPLKHQADTKFSRRS
jgi:hypothetical protein